MIDPITLFPLSFSFFLFTKSDLQGAAVASAGLGEYKQASLFLEKLTKVHGFITQFAMDFLKLTCI